MKHSPMGKKTAAGLLRHAVVDGKEKYVRIAIRRRRTPLCADELEGFLCQYMTENGVDMIAIRDRATELFQEHQYEEAGALCSVLDFIALFLKLTIGADPQGPTE